MEFTNTLYTNDNLFILNGLNSNLVDLIYLDPPFNSKRFYSAPIGSKAAGANFKDIWFWKDVNEEYLNTLAEKYPALTDFIASAGAVHSKAMMAYLTYIAQRIIEMHRILKDTGSLYLHCDTTASHYLKALLDEIFGKDNFKNEIVWERTTDTGSSKSVANRYPTNTDIILFYTKSADRYTFNKQYYEYSNKYILNKFNNNDKDGRGAYRWQVLKSYSQETFDKLKNENMLKKTDSSKYYYYKQYLNEGKGVIISNLWDAEDVVPLGPSSKERTGYPTQKPLALLKRIIEASSNEGDIVLDPFCGCATTCVAAQQLGRKWIGIDIAEQAVDILVERLSDDAGIFKDFINTSAIPQRTDIQRVEPVKSVKERLYKEQNGLCNACGTYFDIWNLEIDHIIPKSKGGGDYYENYQLLCSHCNKMKSDNPMESLRLKIETRKKMLKDKIIFGE
ncbi:MAG: HNH endonuclease [Lentimicrobiaceae bacterium]|nr:HNH endonuclease [Lentimicrobiaceae bacterium]